MKTISIFLLFLLGQFILGQNLPNNCQNFIQICDNLSVSYNVSGPGVQEINPPSCDSFEHNSIWFRVTIAQSGTLSFTVIPQSTDINEDYDFWIFDPSSTCSNLGGIIRCSTTNPAASGAANNHTGLSNSSSDNFEGPGVAGDNFVKNLDVTSGENYFIVIDRPIGNSPFTLNWGGTATIQNPFATLNLPNFPNVLLCDEGANNSEPYNFSQLDNNYLTGLAGYSISYHTTSDNASLNLSPLIGTINVNQGTYYARIFSSSTKCYLVKTVNVIFNNIETNEVAINVCDDLPNNANYNLSLQNQQVYTGSQDVNFVYYNTLTDANNQTNAITNWQNRPLMVGLNTYFIRTQIGTCFDISELKITYIKIPFVNTQITLKQCDDDTNGFSAFNLTEANIKIVSNTTGLTFTYFLNQSDATNNQNAITNVSAFINQSINNQILYYRVNNVNDCFVKIGQLNLIVGASQIPPSFLPLEFSSCDGTFGTNTDGKAIFNFSQAQTTFQNIFIGQNIQISYYENINDALAETNAIPFINTSNYVNVILSVQDIIVRIDSNVNNDCFGIGKYIKLKVESHPLISPKMIRGCDDDNDGFVSFDTTNLSNSILNGQTNVSISYKDSNNNVFSSLPNPLVSNNQNYTIILTNNSTNLCSSSSTLNFIVDQKPIANPIPQNLLTACDDDINNLLNQDGITNFDITNFSNIIIGNQTNVEVKYYDENNTLIPNFTANYTTGNKTITARVINLNNTSCFETIPLTFVVNPLPILINKEEKFICIDAASKIILDAGFTNLAFVNTHSYEWYFNNQIIPNATQYSIEINQPGEYAVKVFNNKLCEVTRNISVKASQKAIIDSVEVVDLTNINSITVNASGVGNYIYSIDGQNYQESPFFNDVNWGVYTIYVKDLNNCGIASKRTVVLSIPKFFTPNNDGFNDFWNVKGFDLKYNKKTVIKIYDRYGMLLKEIFSNTNGWDGKYNNLELPASDYWYFIEMPDESIVKGHFSLKR